MSEKLVRHTYSITRSKRNMQNAHRSFVLWFTGLSGAGKSTIANAVERKLFNLGVQTYTLDGDNIRSGINQGLGFSREDREENLRRVAEMAKLFVDAGMITMTAFISPLREDRNRAKEIIGSADFVEVFVDTSLEECERRDVKGFYQLAREGKISNFTGVSAPYEKPHSPDLIVRTEEQSLEEITDKIVMFVQDRMKIHE